MHVTQPATAHQPKSSHASTPLATGQHSPMVMTENPSEQQPPWLTSIVHTTTEAAFVNQGDNFADPYIPGTHSSTNRTNTLDATACESRKQASKGLIPYTGDCVVKGVSLQTMDTGTAAEKMESINIHAGLVKTSNSARDIHGQPEGTSTDSLQYVGALSAAEPGTGKAMLAHGLQDTLANLTETHAGSGAFDRDRKIRQKQAKLDKLLAVMNKRWSMAPARDP